jgi:hypothetical protein
MRKVYLTLGRTVSKHELDIVDVDYSYHISEIIKLYPEIITYPFGHKVKAIMSFLSKTDGDVLIYQAFDTLSDYISFRDYIRNHNTSLEAVFLGLPDLEKKSTYADFHKQHSRWLSYTPKEIEQLKGKNNQELILLAQKMRSDGVAINWLPSLT